MAAKASIAISEFKIKHADIFAWLYATCCAQENQNAELVNFRKNILRMAAILDTSKTNSEMDPKANLVEYIRRKVGIKASDQTATKVDSIFADGATGWKAALNKIASVDLGAIEEVFEQILEGLKTVRDFIMAHYEHVIRKSHKLLEELDLIMQDLRKIRSSTPILVHLQTRIETSQAAQLV
jgi:hypothetical protein